MCTVLYVNNHVMQVSVVESELLQRERELEQMRGCVEGVQIQLRQALQRVDELVRGEGLALTASLIEVDRGQSQSATDTAATKASASRRGHASSVEDEEEGDGGRRLPGL